MNASYVLIFTKLASFIKIHFVECSDVATIAKLADICNRKTNCMTVRHIGLTEHHAKSAIDVLHALDSVHKINASPKLIRASDVNFNSIDTYVGYNSMGAVDDESVFSFWWSEQWLSGV